MGATGFIYWRVRDRRRVKYKQMRRAAIVRPAAGGGHGPVNGGSHGQAADLGHGAAADVDAAPGPDGAVEDPTGAPALEAEVPVVEAERGDDGG